ncbi:MAG TPA: SRPBCC family protein [Propionicimonas sp.]
MAHISGSIRIAAPPQQVFDTVADSRLEPSFNPAMSEVELLTPGPIGQGTRFLARMAKAGTDMLIELTDFDRPHRLRSRTTSSMMETTGTLTCAGDTGSTLLSWDWQVHPKGWYRPMSPLVWLLGPRMERKIWTGLKHKLEAEASPPTP